VPVRGPTSAVRLRVVEKADSGKPSGRLSVALRRRSPKIPTKSSAATMALPAPGAAQMSRQTLLVASSVPWLMWLRMLRTLCIQHRCGRVSGNTLSNASRGSAAPAATTGCGGFIPRNTRPQHSLLSP